MSYSISLNQSSFIDLPRRLDGPYASGVGLRPVSRPANHIHDIDASIGASSYRLAWVQSIRAEILDGSFETPERIDGTVERLLDILA